MVTNPRSAGRHLSIPEGEGEKNQSGCIRNTNLINMNAGSTCPGRDSLREERYSQDLFDKRPDAGHQLIVKTFGFLIPIRLNGEPHERFGP
jgi:hypothetical protein